MLNLKNKTDCCGCGACEQICPKYSIVLKSDKEGFLYPMIDKDTCVDCNLCTKVCPIIYNKKSDVYDNTPHLKVYAAYNNNIEERLNSSSGGIFTLLAKYIIQQGGVVFGASFDSEWNVVHTYIDSEEGIELLRRSKYVQSRIGESYKQVRNFLKEGRRVLFVGTPCQVAGLRHFLQKKFDNLILVDIICHGVPSPLVWNKYLEEIKCQSAAGKAAHGESTVLDSSKSRPYLKGVNFRGKPDGWRKYRFVLTFAKATAAGEESSVLSSDIHKNSYMRAFLENKCLRPSCHHCYFKKGKSGSDITLADFWGVERIIKDRDYTCDDGTSMVFVNNDSLITILKEIKADFKEIDFEGCCFGNPQYFSSAQKTWGRRVFFNELSKGSVSDAIDKATVFDSKTIFFQRIQNSIKYRLARLWQK